MLDENKKVSSHTEKARPTQVSRRRIIKSLAVGGGVVTSAKMLPERWTSPVVDFVTLPAHAQTSLPTSFAGPVGGPGPSPVGRLLDQLIPPAQAGKLFSSDTLCVDLSTGEAILISEFEDGPSEDFMQIFEGSGAELGGEVALMQTCPPSDNGDSRTLSLMGVSPAGLEFDLDGETGTLPPGAWTNPGCELNGNFQ